MTAYMRAATAFRALAVLAAAGTVWLAVLDHPWLAGLATGAGLLAVFLGGRLHTAHLRTVADQTNRNPHTVTDKENTHR